MKILDELRGNITEYVCYTDHHKEEEEMEDLNINEKYIMEDRNLEDGGWERDVGFEVLAAPITKNSVLWDMTACSLMKIRLCLLHASS
jgi:hypothetical protein